jgi:ABC-type Na+ transport system ATPase subunit NatA
MLAFRQPSVLVSETPSEERSAHIWIVNEASSKGIFKDLSLLLESPCVSFSTGWTFHVHLCDVNLHTDVTILFDNGCDMFTTHDAIIDPHMELDANSINWNIFSFHVLDHINDFVCLVIIKHIVVVVE